MFTGINESKTLTKHISCEYNSNKWWNNNKCRCNCKKHHVCERDYVWNPATFNCLEFNSNL